MHVNCIVCEVYSVFAIHYKYIMEVLEKTLRKTRVDRPFIRKEILRSVLWVALELARGPSLTIFFTFILNKIHDNCKTYSYN